eukprot:1428785-Pleurochrysis_carterae.AAC.1
MQRAVVVSRSAYRRDRRGGRWLETRGAGRACHQRPSRRRARLSSTRPEQYRSVAHAAPNARGGPNRGRRVEPHTWPALSGCSSGEATIAPPTDGCAPQTRQVPAARACHRLSVINGSNSNGEWHIGQASMKTTPALRGAWTSKCSGRGLHAP